MQTPHHHAPPQPQRGGVHQPGATALEKSTALGVTTALAGKEVIISFSEPLKNESAFSLTEMLMACVMILLVMALGVRVWMPFIHADPGKTLAAAQ
ncbi:hypothetical protein GF406_00945, partial [candidate division KSB1 bacterium]|nr:hypothetical protein [candidate division KSB1 bacterium]